MARSGHGLALEERRLNHGLQSLPSGISAFPVARGSEHHKSILQKMPELWSDFSDKGLPNARVGPCGKTSVFHGESSPAGSPHDRMRATAGSSGSFGRPPASTAKSGQVLFVGTAEFDMDGRAHTAGEMDRLMLHAANSKYPCSRPATFDEYAEGAIVGLPEKNKTGLEVVFAGPGATGCELFHTNTLGAQKVIVPPGDTFDGTWAMASLFGRKCVLCVHPVERVKRQQSLALFGQGRKTIGRPAGLRRAGSLAMLEKQKPMGGSLTRTMSSA